MTNIIKQGSSLIIQGDVNSYPFLNGKISLPLNSLYFVIDESNVISFKQVNDNNTLLSVNINNLQINGEEVTKENLIEKFDAVANGSMGGSKINAGTNITLQPQEDGSITISATGELGGTVAWQDVTDKPSTFTPSAHNHVVADITDLQGKLDEKANVSDIPSLDGYATEEWVNSQGYLTEHQDISQLATKSELADKADASALASKQDTLISGTNIKTVNGQTLLGEGNIEIQGGGSGISDAPSDNKLYGRKNANWSEIIIPSTDNFATKAELDGKVDDAEIADMLTKTEASEKYQPKGEYLTEVPAEYVTETELSGKGYLTSIPEEYVTETELSGKGYATTSQLDAKLDTSTYTEDKATFATKAELAGKANTSDLSNYLQTSVAESTYAKKSEIPEEYTLPIATAEALGGIKVGAGLSINPGTGVLSATGGGTADSVDWANITSKPDDIVNITDKLAEKLDVSTYNSDKATFATKEELAGKANSSDLSNYLQTSVAESTYAKKSEIPSLEGYLQTSTADEKYATKAELEGKVDDADIADMLTKTEAASTYQPKGEYLTSVPAEYITESELDAKGYKKIEYLTQSQYDELPTKEEGVLYVITDAPEVVIPDTSTFATKEEIADMATKTWVGEQGFLTEHQDISNLATKQEVTEGLATKQDTLVSGESIKTVNGESILGSGDIVIEGGSTGNDVEEVAGIDNVSVASVNENRIYVDTNTIEDVPSTYAGEVAATIAYGNIYLGNNGKLLKVYDKDTLTKTEASSTYALQTALQAALDRIAALEAQVGNISTQLDNINGEVIN